MSKKLKPIIIPEKRKVFLEKVIYHKKEAVGMPFYQVIPNKLNEKHGLIIVAHGGGFCKGHKQADLFFATMIADKTGYEVWDVDYKLAPQYPYPAAFNQIYDLVKYAYQNAVKLNFDQNDLILMGNSAGGNLVIAAALKANQTQDFKVKLLNANYPPLDLATDPADKPEAEKSYIPYACSREYNRMYADADAARTPYVSPVRASEKMLAGFPQLLMITAGQDALHNEGEDFAFKCMIAGSLVTIKKFEHSEHSFMVNCLGDEWQDACALVVRTINNLHRK
ncbi:alpha/beta hydrolase [Lactobacillus crispatus]|uniref:alpha/beta hydrolase n=1 Tax=Lactobacillus crispatus TaxID=47770 RepID=UPI0018E33CD0|nr:alpha/beta hydrolase [Lactobacillus crispatus]MBI1696285.1 esterase [Lactobacillus crispatus]